MSEKTHQPTEKKLRDARQKGQLPRSKLFTSAAVTLGGLTATLAFADDTARRFVGWTRALLSSQDLAPADALHQGVTVLAQCAAPSLVEQRSRRSSQPSRWRGCSSTPTR